MIGSHLIGPVGWLAGILTLAVFGLPPHGQAPPAKKADLSKKKVEFPAKNLLAGAGASVVGPMAEPDNPAVPPGKVRWHTDFDTACQAAQKSGKPVLLFQMLGKLDQQFC